MHYNYRFVFPFEKGVDRAYAVQIVADMESIYYPYAFLICAIYMAAIAIGQRLMARRAAFNARTELVIWNVFLSIFSILGAARFLPDFIATLAQDGFYHSICVADYTEGVPGWWCVMFAASKLFELGDTVFLVLRKRDVIFLHWYHHVTVLLYTWHGFMEMTAAGRWFIAMNFAVHAVMYPYYLVRALGLRVPKWIPISITAGQLSQMFMGCGIVVTIAYSRFVSGRECDMSNTNLLAASVVYATYMLLFLHFFYNAYIKKRSSVTKPPPAKSAAMKNGGHYANGITNADQVANGHTKHD